MEEKTLEELQKLSDEKSERIGQLKERERILDEIKLADLPVGTWQRIRKIINPEAI